MIMHFIRVSLLMAATSLLFVGASAYTDSADARSAAHAKSNTSKSSKKAPVSKSAAINAGDTYIVRFAEPPLGLYKGGIQKMAKVPTKVQENGRARLDVHSPEAQAYVSYLQDLQTTRLDGMKTALGHSLTVRFQMQHALNAVVVDLTPEEAKRVQSMEGVEAVERDFYNPLATDSGPGFIGAASMWWGAKAGQDTMFANSFDDDVGTGGQGVVIGDIDTGYNSASPSFSATDDRGYTIHNPLGNGVYLGDCSLSTSASAPCNAKVIGRYDAISRITTPLPAMSAYTVEDTGGHGSHTGSTAAGNTRTATIRDFTTRITGVAPHANLIIYRACDANGCKQSATSASVNQAIADGVVDVLTYSISGGTDFWNDSTSQAFLTATISGIFVAAAGGNTSPTVPTPVPGTVNHFEPWVLTVAASTHQAKALGGQLSVTGPGTPPANTRNLSLAEANGTAYTHFSANIPGTTPIILSPSFHNNDTMGSDGCSAYPAGRFMGGIALISRGTCCFKMKVRNATTAGAVAVVISDNRVEDPISPSISPSTADCSVAGTITTPTFGISQADGTALQTYLMGATGATAQIPYHYERTPTQADTLAKFSLLGPAEVNVVKPEVQAPGVSILAAVARSGTNPNLVDFLDGTSMATPHTAGAAALIIAAHPTWTPSMVKSALMMTAKETGLTKADGMATSDAFDRGAGRIQVDKATHAGLVLHEDNYGAYNPKYGTFDMSTLNVPSMQQSNCVTVTPGTPATASTKTCSFTRRFRGTQNIGSWIQYSATLTGVTGTVTPSTFSVFVDGTQNVTVNVDASAYASDGAYHFGELVLTSTNFPNLPPLHLPIAVAVKAPTIYTPPTIPINVTAGGTGSYTFHVQNVGGPTLNVTDTNLRDAEGAAPTHVYLPANQTVPHVNNGNMSTLFSDAMSGIYAADDFTIAADPLVHKGTVSLSRIQVMGFMTGTATLASLAGHNIHFEIYQDAGGKPAGAPEALYDTSVDPPTPIAPGDPGNDLPVWSFVGVIGSTPPTMTMMTSPGLTITSAGGTDQITLDLTNPAYTGDQPSLFSGRYWLLVYPETDFSTQKGWAWAQAKVGNGSPWKGFAPAVYDPMAMPPDDPPAWASLGSVGGVMRIEQRVVCGAPWLTTSRPTMTLPGLIDATVGVSVDGTDLLSGDSRVAYLCLRSNDATNNIQVVRVEATVP